MSHRILWADDGIVGYHCGISFACYTLDSEDGWSDCGFCGKKIKLKWNVEIVEKK